eukprot:CAMPEP_0184517022 /NCGR_PEP_ID=MMETSP0198_2-20121128/5340_1 /TAXON_ID=1112570 /ORGANISM="Thraustochytrium sp., Strain LLF1b" /LENGTH=191 /DNA_ID=CAMNT_0026907381 /DNA_START=178 /DNA_END=753 /DNA_ORIENTATION=+
MARVLRAARRVLLQGETLLSGMERQGLDGVYGRPCTVVGASIGAHTRHTLDHFNCIVDAVLDKKGLGGGLVQYDKRLRGGDVESSLTSAVESLFECSEKMGKIDPEWLTLPLNVEFCLEGKDGFTEVMSSNGERELWFAAHHAIHHAAMIKLIVQCCDCPTERELFRKAIPLDFGMAPSTIAATSESIEEK